MKNIFSFLRRVNRSRLVITLLGLASLVWFLIRVIPKPSRALYPCQRAAFPIATAFIIWLTGSVLSFITFTTAKKHFVLKRYRSAISLSALFILSLATLYFALPDNPVLAKIALNKNLPDLTVDRKAIDAQSILPNAWVSIVKSDKSKTSDITKSEVEDMVYKAIDLAGGLDDIIADGDVVILKPNMVVYDFNGGALPTEGNGMVTDWRVAAAMAKKVRALNPSGKIILMEGSAGESTLEAFDVLNYKPSSIPEIDEYIAIEDASGDWHDYESAELSKVKLPEGKGLYSNALKPNEAEEFYLNRIYYEADVLISLPVLKNHGSAGVTGAVKNLSIGCTPTSIYGNSESANGRWDVIPHNNNLTEFHYFLHDFYMARPADFAVMDGLQGYNNGPVWNDGTMYLAGHQENMRVILASKDPIAMDAIEALVMGDNPAKVRYLVHLNNSGVGCSDQLAIKVAGKQVGEIKKDFPHNATPPRADDYSDFTSPEAALIALSFVDNKMLISLNAAEDVVKVDIEIDEQVYPPIFTSNFDQIEVDLSDFELSDTLVAIHVQDEFLNTTTLSKSDVVNSIEQHVLDIELSLYPNPVLDELNLKLGSASMYELVIYNMEGKPVLQHSADYSSLITLDCRNLQKGMYIGRIKTSQGISGFKFLKAD